MEFPQRLSNQLEKRELSKNYRSLKTIDGLIDFSSNDYLGLANNPELISLVETKTKNISLGATGSRLLTGNSKHAEEVETFLAELFKSEKSLIFNSGYNANLAVLSSIPQRGDHVFYDELSHTCIKDGIRLSSAKKVMFRHNDLEDLKNKISGVDGQKYVVVESVYSMDGDRCPLTKLVDLCQEFKALLIIDEAHSTGVLGNNGGGLSELYNLEDKIFCRIYTFGKAIGCHGATVSGSKLLVDYLINYARPFIYTTALPPHSYITIKSSFKFLNEHTYLKEQLANNITYYQQLFEEMLQDKYESSKSNSAIQTLLIPGNNEAKRLAEELQSKGFNIRPILSPTVKEGQERLRVCLHSFNTDNEISSLITSLAAL